jgi:TRAP-type C4-dicarboxylate transport system substrate-binding protein
MMLVNRITRCAVGAVLLAPTVGLAGCVDPGGDKAGGAEEPEPVVLTFASFTEPEPQQLRVFADEVARRSAGTMQIKFRWPWRPGDPNAERGTIEDVKAGKVDMAWVGARVFDTLDVTSFQALLAPLLVDSYDLEERVFESGIPTSMLEDVEELGVVGLGVLPGPIQRLLGINHPFLEPSSFEGQVVGGLENELSVRTFEALGARLEALHAGGSLDGLDATVQQLGSIWDNRYYRDAKYVAANVNLWPRPLVIFAGDEFFESLTPEQQAVLRDAATAAVPGALAASRAEDDEARSDLCRRSLTFALASASDLEALHRALEPVYADLLVDPDTEAHIDAITNLKTEIAASAETPSCASAEAPATGSLIPDGTYETRVTEADYRKAGVSEQVGANPGVFRMILEAGEWTFIGPIRDGESSDDGEKGTYTVFRDQLEVRVAEDVTITARWSRDGKALTFTDIDCCGGNAGALAAIWESHPWLKID